MVLGGVRGASGRRGGGDEGFGFVALRGGVGWAAYEREVMHIMTGGLYEYDHVVCIEVLWKSMIQPK